MSSIISELTKKKLIQPPNWLETNVCYEAVMGSIAYGVSADSSDFDVYSFCIPPKVTIFPHLDGYVSGFGSKPPEFEQFQKHHISDPTALGGKGREYDITCFSIVKYFDLLMGNSPNVLDSIFVPHECVLHSTSVGNMVRENRKLFVHKGCFQKLKGYAYSQLHKLRTKSHEYLNKVKALEEELGIPNTVTFEELKTEKETRDKWYEEYCTKYHEYHNSPFWKRWFKAFVPPHVPDTGSALNPRRCKLTYLDRNCAFINYYQIYSKMIESSGRSERVKIEEFDRKFAYHVARLVDECEQLLEFGEMDLRRSREFMKAIRKGEVSLEELNNWFSVKEKELEILYNKSLLPSKPDEKAIKNLLLSCLEEHYGKLDNCIQVPDASKVVLRQIQEILNKNQNLLES